ncbi:PIN domain-containing protein [Deinococcus aetherius]|uniref:PIN domain-containing protein n=1 Tax=Deinococcus aetherius TaxID=200252 RepID=A0ABM8ABQ3_9DEIO|nr:type II toxin-antitoxin system VapC family toxin [Deinococcus aetherius]BDP41046.1 PIN domain-containing protein [Deinococcus aetherius]
MTTTLDSNVISALLRGEGTEAAIRRVLNASRQQGELLVCGVVHAELLAGPGITASLLDRFLDATGIRVDWLLEEAIWRSAGAAFAPYAGKRRTSGGGTPRRLLADFLIGAHAAVRGARLITLDAAHYKTSFADLEVVIPAW